MHKKILIVTSDRQEKEKIETIFEEMMEKGGELLFVDKKEDIMPLLDKEHPQLVFLDGDLMGSDTFPEIAEMHIVWIRKKGDARMEGEDTLFKPFTAHDVVAKCRQVMDLSLWEKVNPFPM